MKITLNKLPFYNSYLGDHPSYPMTTCAVDARDIEVLYPTPALTRCLIAAEPTSFYVENSYLSLNQALKKAGIDIVSTKAVPFRGDKPSAVGINPLAVSKIVPKSPLLHLFGLNKNSIVTFFSGHTIEVLTPATPLKSRILRGKTRFSGVPANR